MEFPPVAMTQGSSMGAERDLAIQRLHTAFDLFEAGCELKRLALVREHPELGAEGISRLLAAWLQDKPPPMAGVPGFRVRTSWP
jgi:hypothetical protein